MSDLYLGLLLSIPVGLIINLVSPAILRYVSNRNQKASTKRAAEDQAFQDRVTAFNKNRPALYTYLLGTLIRIAWIGALFGILTAGLGLVGQGLQTIASDISFGSTVFRISGTAFFCSQLSYLVGTLIVLNIAREAFQIIRQVRGLGAQP